MQIACPKVHCFAHAILIFFFLIKHWVFYQKENNSGGGRRGGRESLIKRNSVQKVKKYFMYKPSKTCPSRDNVPLTKINVSACTSRTRK
jgi:hypothetical protein